MSDALASELLVRVEEAGINASAPREQLWVDGWLVRLSRGKAKRARCIQAVAPGRFPVETRLRRCFALYERAGLHPYVRLTPYSQPEGLDEHLAELGLERIDDTRVMLAPLAEAVFDSRGPETAGVRFLATDAASFADWIGTQRGSSSLERQAHADRLRHVPIPHHAILVLDPAGAVVGGGQVALEGDLAGLYDIFTVVSARERGLAHSLCGELLRHAAAQGARTAYLQVDAGNETARRVYRRLGFEDAYAYHYRSPKAP